MCLYWYLFFNNPDDYFLIEEKKGIEDEVPSPKNSSLSGSFGVYDHLKTEGGYLNGVTYSEIVLNMWSHDDFSLSGWSIIIHF